MNNTGIDWTEVTWNPVTGCTKCSRGCKNCYAETQALRLQRMGNPRYRNGFKVTLHPDKLDEPLRMRKGRMIFVNSMSDLLHKDVPDEFIKAAFDTMRDCPQHTFQVLTKRADRWPEVEELVEGLPLNVWPGVSIEDEKHMTRLYPLSILLPGTKFVSFEPVLGPVAKSPGGLANLLLGSGIRWVISGGESGFKARPAELDWFRTIRDACQLAGIPLFHKQHGGRGVTHKAKRSGELAAIDGVVHQAYPAS
jgi:protein gp37